MKKAAFLLIAAAWLTGSAEGSGRSSSCCTPAPSCDPCCQKQGLFDRFRGLFHRGGDCCQPTCAPACAPACAPTCAPACTTSCGHGPRHTFHRSDCCDDGCGRPSLLDKLRSRFRKHDCCAPACDTGCGGTVIHGAPGAGGVYGGGLAPKTGEVITSPPKKLPGAGGGAGDGAGKTGLDSPGGEVRIITPPAAAPIPTPAAIPTVPVVPGLETRSPF